MVTGDHPLTAVAIARICGIVSKDAKLANDFIKAQISTEATKNLLMKVDHMLVEAQYGRMFYHQYAEDENFAF